MRKPKQFEFKKVKGWGGKRSGAGRPNKSQTVNHMKRTEVNFKVPLMITMKLKPGLKGLRTKKMLKKFEQCGKEVKKFGLHILHFSIESNHIHFKAEARDNQSLGSGTKSLGARLGKAVRKEIGGKGSVFAGRYHLKALKTPTETRNAMAYVLLNQSKHQKRHPYPDEFSSAIHFYDWKALLGKNIGPVLANWKMRKKPLPDYLSEPRSWLAREGWRKARVA